MANITKKRITDDILEILTRFSKTDENVIDEDWLSEKIDQVRSQLIIASYRDDGVVDSTWLSDLSIQTLHEVTFADDPNISFCCSDISKAFIPNVVSLRARGDGNIDLGIFNILSACGTKEYYNFPMSSWKIIPSEHVRSKFNYYSRINTSLYVNKKVEKLLIRAVLEHPQDGYIIDSEPVTDILAGVLYIVRNAQIVYNGVVYPKGSTFTGISGITTFAGSGDVYLQSQLVSLSETYPYPVSSDMARMIVLEICTKEFGIEESQLIDVKNDTTDDTTKTKT